MLLAIRRCRQTETAARRLLSSWATVDPGSLSGDAPGIVQNLVAGSWTGTTSQRSLPDPLTGQPFIKVPDTSPAEIAPFVHSLAAVPKHGLHNPYKNPERYLMYGDVSFRVAQEMRKPEVADFFARLIQRVAPKSWAQASAEVRVTRAFYENFSGDQVRFLARGFSNPGDHTGQTSGGVRWPYGPVAIITPFNFPLEIPALQLMGALYMGNKPLLHVDQRVSVVAEQLLRLLHHCGMPSTDVDLLVGPGATMGEVLAQAQPRNTLFTGSQRVAERLAVQLAGKVFLEDAGFDWKVLGPDVRDLEYVAWQCDQDAYACSGQKCSAQSMLFVHDNWAKAGLLDRLRDRAAARTLDDLSIGPVLTWTTEAMLDHVAQLLRIPGAKLLFGGRPLTGHTIPSVYGAIEPTAVFVPLEEAMKAEHWGHVTTELFGPFQVVTQYGDGQVQLMLDALERMSHHLTAAVVSNDINFVQHVLAHTVNGTTYAGIRARTTGAPQNHWFGPAGDPRGAGIGTPEAIRHVWSCHREIITDFGPVPVGLSLTTS
ncbi:aldehyde dehydrogenase [Haematococcus lacustris]